MLVGIGSVKGSPGVTTLALGLASVWPGRSVALIEVDPSGGDLGVWWRVGSDPGLVSLAGAARRGRSGGVDLLDHARELGSGLWVVPGPAGAEQARAAVQVLADHGEVLPVAGCRFDAVILDVGRVGPGSPARGLLPSLDVLLLAGRGTVPELTHLVCASPGLVEAAGEAWIGAVLTQGCRYRVSEVEEALGIPLLAVTPADPGAAAMLAGAPSRHGGRVSRGRTCPLLGALGDLAARVIPLARPPARPRVPALAAARTHGAGRYLERAPSRPVPRTAQEAGWTRPAPGPTAPATTGPAARRTS